MKPIIFNTEMVKAILEDRKTATRRVVKPQPLGRIAYCMAGYKSGTWSYPGDTTYQFWGDEWRVPEGLTKDERNRHWTPPCNVGDILYVRETWRPAEVRCDGGTEFFYYADGFSDASDKPETGRRKWRPSIHMPKEAARIFLRVTDVRVERLQDCGNAQAKDEGCTCCSQFVRIWDSTIKPADSDRYGWEANPWVWVIEFQRCEKPERGRE